MFNQHVVFYVLLSSMCEGGVTPVVVVGNIFPAWGKLPLKQKKGETCLLLRSSCPPRLGLVSHNLAVKTDPTQPDMPCSPL